jgi:hypothetical protein
LGHLLFSYLVTVDNDVSGTTFCFLGIQVAVVTMLKPQRKQNKSKPSSKKIKMPRTIDNPVVQLSRLEISKINRVSRKRK